MFNLFGQKKKVEKLRKDVQDSFDSVKKDFGKVSEWITHLDDKHSNYRDELVAIKDQVLTIQNDIIEIKDFISFFGPQLSTTLSKHKQTDINKQPHFVGVPTIVQTPVQTDILSNLTVMERGIVWALLNSEMKLSYEDLAALLGKNKSTIRGQINTIKQKNPNLILESREISGKKRLHIPDNLKNSVIKGLKVKINKKRQEKTKSES